MPTTTLVDSTFSASVIGSRTDTAGAAVTDLSAEEARMTASFFNPGYLSPTNSFLVSAQTSPNMTVRVGSGVAKTDYYVLSGTVAGQGNYLVRLDAVYPSVTIGAADPSQPRTDEVYLVVQDNLYDLSSRALPRIGYRKGDLAGGNPGPDAAWTAYALLARVAVAAAATSITNGNITDQRVASSLPASVSVKSLFTTKGDLLAGLGASSAVRVPVGTDGLALKADSTQTAGVGWGAIAAAGTGFVFTEESTTVNAFGNLATTGPTVTLNVGPLGIAIVSWTYLYFTVGAAAGAMHYTLSGANTVAANLTNSLETAIPASAQSLQTFQKVAVHTGLTAGSTTFQAKYQSNNPGSAAYFESRGLQVVTF